MAQIKRVLIVEDNPVNMELSTDLLDAAGYTVITAETAEEGIRLAVEQAPDLVLMDIALPGMDGLSATGVLLSDPRTAHIPVVALTAHAMRGDEDRALAAGCVGYITKPINTRSFARLVDEFASVLPTVRPSGQPLPSNTAVSMPTGPHPRLLSFDEEEGALFPLGLRPNLAGGMSPGTPPKSGTEGLRPLPTDYLEHLSPSPPAVARADPFPPTPAAPAARDEPPTDPSLPSAEQVRAYKPNAPKQSASPAAVTPQPAAPSAEKSPLDSVPMLPASDTGSTIPMEPLSIVRPTSYIPKLTKSGRRRVETADVSDLRRAHEAPRVLVVDDDPLNREVMAGILHQLGCEAVVAENGFEALDILDHTFDIVLLDYMMPVMDGCKTLLAIREELHLTDLPVIMVTALSSREDRLTAVEAGANDFVTKPVDRTELRVRMASLLKMKAAQDSLRKHQRDLESTIKERTADLRKALQQLTQAQQQERLAHRDTLHRMALAAEFRDGETAAAHIRAVGNYCAAIARSLGLPEQTVETLLHASPVHDIGMLGVPEAVLMKRPGERTPEEELMFRQHTVLGARLLSGAQSEELRAGEIIAISHHERWDGDGFPQGVEGERIPLFGRICAIADSFDMLTAYRQGGEYFSNEEARERMMAGRGTAFDPTILDAFFESWDEILQLQRQFRRTEAPPADVRLSGPFAFLAK